MDQVPPRGPSRGQGIAQKLLETASRPHSFLKALAQPADIACPPFRKANPRPGFTLPADLPEELAQAIGLLLDAFQCAEEILSPMMTRVSPEELNLIEKYFYPEAASKATGDEEAEELPKTGEMKEALRTLVKIDRGAILKAALIVTEALERAVDIVTRVESWEGKVATVSFMTPTGLVKIGGTGPDTHQEKAALIIDLGGDDTYNGEVASGRDGKCALVLDLDGDDNYLGKDFTQGAGFRGIGILRDLKGDDLYRAGRCSQGAGLFGVGLLVDGSGSDMYLGESFVQAAALWGWGGLVDLEGEDSYLCGHTGQAYAGVMGVSCLSDREGNDKYLSGSGAPDRREPGMNQSFSQGFAVGMRDMVAGGFALLTDGSGNDHYQCGYFGQGSSYWMAVGILYDERGTDTYTARRYSQGAGIHFSLGLLLDVEGNDHTYAWGVSQGCGHDYGIGMLVNESGDDTYVSGWLCMGASEANGIGLFLDNAGNDGYDNTQGMAVGRLIQNRRAGGPGIFVDAGGKDRYSGPGADNSMWGANRWSISVHADTALTLLIEKAEDPNSRISSRALSYLGILRDTRALNACIKGLEHRSWRVRSSAAGAMGEMLDKKRLKDHAPWVRDASVLALARFGDEAVEPLVSAMDAEIPSFKILGLDVLGRLKSEESGKIPERYMNDPHPGVRRSAGQALKNHEN